MGPATYGCERCEKKYNMGDETHVWLFLKQPWFNHIITQCPGCKITYRVWNLTEATVRYMEQNNMVEDDEVHWHVLDFAPDPVPFLFARDEDKPLIQEITRSDRRLKDDENHILFFRFLLERGDEE